VPSVSDRSRARRWQNLLNRGLTALFRLRKGRLAFKGAPLAILHTTGRRSGTPRQTPLLYLDLDGAIAVVGSNGGDDRTPAWVHNVVARPDVEVELRGARIPMRAQVADDARRAELWPRAVAAYPQYGKYQDQTERTIPLVLLTPRP
jgi:deazaflavin-dependent oxidoreductase (nitroreductase family)